MSRLVPLIIEFFFPSLGLLYMGRIVHGLIKLFCILVFCLYRLKLLTNVVIVGLSSLTFLLLYAIDLICLLFAVYLDGNGMPLL